MKLHLSLIVFILFLFPVFLSAEDFAVYGPVVTYPEKDADEVTIFFYTDEKERSSIYISNDVTNYTEIDSGKKKYHQFEVETENCTFVYYRIISNTRDIKGANGSILLPNETEYRFGVYGNTYNSYDVNEDIGELMIDLRPSFIINTGNIIQESINKQEWELYFNSGSSILSSAAFMPVVGTVDFYSAIWKRTFDVSNNRYPFYSYELPLMSVIVLNSAMYLAEDSVQYRWFIEELEDVPEGCFTVVAFHHSPFTPNDQISQVISTLLCPVMEEHGVDLVFNGNSLIYERSEKNGITYINTGGAFNNMNGVDFSNPYRMSITTGVNHYIIGKVTPDSIEISAYGLDDTELDNIIIEK